MASSPILIVLTKTLPSHVFFIIVIFSSSSSFLYSPPPITSTSSTHTTTTTTATTSPLQGLLIVCTVICRPQSSRTCWDKDESSYSILQITLCIPQGQLKQIHTYPEHDKPQKLNFPSCMCRFSSWKSCIKFMNN